MPRGTGNWTGRGRGRGRRKGTAVSCKAMNGRHILRQATQMSKALTSESDRTMRKSGEILIPHHRSEVSSECLAGRNQPSHVIPMGRRTGTIAHTLRRAETSMMAGIHVVGRSIHRTTVGDRQGRRVRAMNTSETLFAGRRASWRAASTERVQMVTSPPCPSTPANIRLSSDETASFNPTPKRGSGILATGRRRVASRVARGRKSAMSRSQNVSSSPSPSVFVGLFSFVRAGRDFGLVYFFLAFKKVLTILQVAIVFVGALFVPGTRHSEGPGRSPKTSPLQFRSSRRIPLIFLPVLMGCLNNHNNNSRSNNRARMEANLCPTRSSSTSASLFLLIEANPSG